MSLHAFAARKLHRNASENLLSMVKWFPAENGEVPINAVEVGHIEGKNGTEFYYVGRILMADDIVPGTIIPSKKACFAAFDGNEVSSPKYEVLVNTQPLLCQVHWAGLTADAAMHKNAVPVGTRISNNNNQQPLYAGRAHPAGSTTSNYHVCKLRDGDLKAVMSYNGQSITVDDFKILCLKDTSSK